MLLLHNWVRKVTRIIKNQQRLINNQKIIVARLSSQTPDDPLTIESVNDSDEEDEALIEEYSDDVKHASTSGLRVGAVKSNFRSDDGSIGGNGDVNKVNDDEDGDSEHGDDAKDVADEE